jgi:hypothetical protein
LQECFGQREDLDRETKESGQNKMNEENYFLENEARLNEKFWKRLTD